MIGKIKISGKGTNRPDEKDRYKGWFFSVRYVDQFGVTRTKKVQRSDWSKKDAEEALAEFKASQVGSVSKITVDQLYRAFVADRAERTKEKSAYTFESLYNTHIKPYFGKAVVASITPKHITVWQNQIKQKGYKNSYLMTIQEHFTRLLNFGVRYGYIDKSPFVNRFVKDVTQRKVEMSYWTIDEFNLFIDKADSEVMRAFFMTLYWTGIRRGEAVALEVRDVDFERNTINISKTFDPVFRKTTTPKTANSYRSVQMPMALRETLKEHIELSKDDDGFGPDSFLFGTSTPLVAETIKQSQIRSAEKAGVKIIKIHEFRHSHVSLLISMGFSSFEIAKRLGHTQAMVENVYGHWLPSQQEEMIKRLDEAAADHEAKTKTARS